MFPHFHLVRNNLGEAKMTISLRGSPGLIISMETESRHKSNKKGFYFFVLRNTMTFSQKRELRGRNLFFKSCTFISGSVKSPEIGSPQVEVESGVSRAIRKGNAVNGNMFMFFSSRGIPPCDCLFETHDKCLTHLLLGDPLKSTCL